MNPTLVNGYNLTSYLTHVEIIINVLKNLTVGSSTETVRKNQINAYIHTYLHTYIQFDSWKCSIKYNLICLLKMFIMGSGVVTKL